MTTIHDADRWNHNIHYHRWLLGVVPSSAQDILDVGCGEGQLARRLAQIASGVVGLDTDPAGIAMACAISPQTVRFVVGDLLTYPLVPHSFDAIVSVATLHHLDARTALTRIRELVRPGGVVAIVGVARSTGPRDIPWEVGALVAHRCALRMHRYWEHPSPTVWPPPLTYRGMRMVADEVLPGNTFRRRLLWRYTLTWRAPL